MPDAHRVVADAEALLHRVSPDGRDMARRARRRRFARRMRILRRMLAAAAAIVVLAIAWGLAIGPIGQFGFLAALAALIVSWVVIMTMAREPVETPRTLAASDLALLPQRTEAWLQRQRPALPAPAARLVEGIGLKLADLGPQLATLDAREPAAVELRKLLSTELPELIEGYQRVPANLRRSERDGPSPDRQLADALGVVDRRLAEMSENLASGDLRRLATQGRYLELKYKDGDAT